MRLTWPGPHPLNDLSRNLWAACHMLAFRRSALRWLMPSPLAFVVLFLLSLSASFSFDLISEGLPGEWSPAGFAVYTLPTFVLLVFGQMLSARHGLWRLGLAPATLWLAADVLLGYTQCLLLFADQHRLLPSSLIPHLSTLYTLLYVWPILALVFVFTRALAWPWWERAGAFSLLCAVFAVWSLSFSDERLWHAVVPAAPTQPPARILEEKVLYAQPELLQRALTALQPERPEQVDWYFLGVAGASYQNVFRSEVEGARSVFDSRFAGSGRSLLLINNDDTVDAQPIATRTSIARALQATAARMDTENDVLFLFLTSHGSEAHDIELSYWPLDLGGVSPSWLRRVLDESGIRRRVIVLSACYSGGFIPLLRSPDTLVITASSADKTSFGCSDDADYTYFGRAFFDEALRREYGFRAAFDVAVGRVHEREQAQGFESSEPQWDIGEQLAADLPQLEATLFPVRP
ncbi:MAG: C13 family peptidase [Moraxellaceae bacterium]|nr:C13 family peptidase [Moraxellaceae bacterium]